MGSQSSKDNDEHGYSDEYLQSVMNPDYWNDYNNNISYYPNMNMQQPQFDKTHDFRAKNMYHAANPDDKKKSVPAPIPPRVPVKTRVPAIMAMPVLVQAPKQPEPPKNKIFVKGPLSQPTANTKNDWYKYENAKWEKYYYKLRPKKSAKPMKKFGFDSRSDTADPTESENVESPGADDDATENDINYTSNNTNPYSNVVMSNRLLANNPYAFDYYTHTMSKIDF